MNTPNNVSGYISYFRNLAQHHAELLHNPDSETGDAPIGSQHFASVSIDEVVTNALRSKASSPMLLLELYETETSSEVAYDVRQNPRGAFMVLAHPERDTFYHEEQAYAKAEKIIYETLQQIWKDHFGTGVTRCTTPFEHFDFDKLTITPVGPLFDKEFGYRVEFSFKLQNTINLASPPPEGAFNWEP